MAIQTPNGGVRARRCLYCGEPLHPDEPVVVNFRKKYAAKSSVAALGEFDREALALAHEHCQNNWPAGRD